MPLSFLGTIATRLPSTSWGLERPWAAALLLLPLLLLLLSLRRVDRRTVLLGTARFFSGLAGAGGKSSSRRLSASRILAALALVAATAALMGPSPRAGAEPEMTWLVVVDRSPSMHLQVAPGSNDSRLEAALAAARDLLEESSGSSDVRVRFLDGSRPGAAAGAVRSLSEGAPAELLEVPEEDLAAPAWGAFDRAGVLWVTDREPGPAPSEAGWVASGGAAVPGPVGVGARGALVWDGPGSEPRWDEGRRRRCLVRGAVDPVLEAFVRDWANDRGVVLVDGAAEGVELVVEGRGPLPAGAASRSGGRDGWRVGFSAGPAELAGVPWWTYGEAALVARRRGSVEFAPLRLGGEPAPADAFAVSMAGLLDEALATPRWLVPFGEREGAGDASVRAPLMPPRAAADQESARGDRDRGRRLAVTVLAVLAAVLGALAAVLRARGSR